MKAIKNTQNKQKQKQRNIIKKRANKHKKYNEPKMKWKIIRKQKYEKRK